MKISAYAGIGSRDTPLNIRLMMREIAATLEQNGYLLRSGGADGADLAFESGVTYDENKEIYLPWNGFNGSKSKLSLDHLFRDPADPLRDKVERIAIKHHRAWKNCSYGARKMHFRNVFQIYGYDFLNPSEFVICWTKDGKDSGGTGQALRIASSENIPIFNLFNEKDRAALWSRFNWSGDFLGLAR